MFPDKLGYKTTIPETTAEPVLNTANTSGTDKTLSIKLDKTLSIKLGKPTKIQLYNYLGVVHQNAPKA